LFNMENVDKERVVIGGAGLAVLANHSSFVDGIREQIPVIASLQGSLDHLLAGIAMPFLLGKGMDYIAEKYEYLTVNKFGLYLGASAYYEASQCMSRGSFQVDELAWDAVGVTLGYLMNESFLAKSKN